MTGFTDILPALHALLATFLGAAERDMSLPKLGRLTRTICRLARIIMSIDVYIYQSKVKAEMLADVNWRNRVINELGGYPALREWQARFYAAPQRVSPLRGSFALRRCRVPPLTLTAAVMRQMTSRHQCPLCQGLTNLFRWSHVSFGLPSKNSGRGPRRVIRQRILSITTRYARRPQVSGFPLDRGKPPDK